MENQLTIQKIIDFNERIIPKSLFDSIITSTTLPPKALEERNSEIWNYSYLGYGKVTLKDGSTYTGSAKFGILETEKGKNCKIDFADGTKYEGQIKNNQLTGKGTYLFPSGATYEGEIVNGLRHGYGKYKSKDGITYEGEWKDGKKEGNGIMVKGDMTYEGSFSKGVIDGYGKLYWSNGNIYEGNFNHNLINGNGTMIWMDSNEKYTGQWINNLQNGFGIHIWYENNNNNTNKGLRNRYVGQWKNGIRNGYGVFFYANGCKYEGFWENNLKHGFGIYRFKNGNEYIGRFEQDRMMDYQNEGIIEVNHDKSEYFSNYDYKKNDDGKKKGKFNLSEKKSNKNIVLPKIESAKVEDNKKKSDLEIIMENDNGKNKNEKGNENEKERGGKKKKSKKVTSKEEFKIQEVIQIPTTNILENEIYYSSKRVIKENEKNQYLTLMDISDILELQDNYLETYKEISNSILLNLTEIKKAYTKLLKINFDDPEFFFFQKIGSTFTNNLNDEDIGNTNNNNNNNQKDDKIGTYLELKDMWKFLREHGIIDENFSIAQFDRIFYKGKKNIEEMFLVPEDIPRIQIYDYIYLMIKKSLRQFKNKYENFMKFTKKEKEILDKHIQEKNSLKDINLVSNETDNKNLELYFEEEKIDPSLISFNYHNHKNTIQFHQFIEALIRVAFMKYINLDISFSKKMEMIINKFVIKKTKEKGEKLSSKLGASNLLRSGIMHDSEQYITHSSTNQKKNNTEHIYIDNFIQKYEIIMKGIFFKLYHHQNELTDFKLDKFNTENNEDMTLTHRFIYQHLVLKSDIIKEFYGKKENYCNYIVYYFKDKKNDFKTNKDKFDYYEDLFDIELIFYEFCEFLYFALNKYIEKNNLNSEDEKNFAFFFDHLYKVIESNYDFNNRKIVIKAKYNYIMPVLKSHVEKQTMIDSNLRKAHLDLLKRFEKLRVAKERRNMELEEGNVLNIYNEEEEEEEEEENDDY